MSRRAPRRLDLAGLVLALACLSTACEPELVIGKVTTEKATCELPNAAGGAPGIEDKVVDIGFTTGFENGFCDYEQALGFCYPPGTYESVDTPVHTGASAAAFSVTGQPGGSPDSTQSRCFLEGALPREAVYGAWFYIPELAENAGNWNLMYFQRIPVELRPGLWDVSLANSPDGSLHLYVFGQMDAGFRTPDPPVPVPIGSWFHVEFRLLRAADPTGEIALYQDGVELLRETGIVTDDGEFQQWYVGNLADDLTPRASTIYVDDVTVRAP